MWGSTRQTGVPSQKKKSRRCSPRAFPDEGWQCHASCTVDARCACSVWPWLCPSFGLALRSQGSPLHGVLLTRTLSTYLHFHAVPRPALAWRLSTRLQRLPFGMLNIRSVGLPPEFAAEPEIDTVTDARRLEVVVEAPVVPPPALRSDTPLPWSRLLWGCWSDDADSRQN